ncbi:MAG: IscS subfamily cysteine desulfurase [Candidatus Margulisiibacteriota bacterium]|jgi:cysteine desulfurase
MANKYRRVYADNNATTPVHPEVQKAIIEALPIFGNASSLHQYGREASHKIESARQKIAGFLGASPEEIVFTGCGTESNNTVLNSIFCGCQRCGKQQKHPHVITSKIEHPSVLTTLKCLERRGVEVSYINVDKYGMVDPHEVQKEIRDNTSLISIMYANNEIGTIQPLKEISEIAHARNILMHTDAVQAVGKVPFKLADIDVDFLSLSGHKVYAPKGIGVLYVRKGINFCPLIYGGHHEGNRRAGTENSLGIIALGKAFEMLEKEMPAELVRMKILRQKLKDGIEKLIPEISFNGHPLDVQPGTLNVSIDYIEGEAILLHLDLEGIAVSTGSACASGSLDPSHVMQALGIPIEKVHSSIRFSLGRENTPEDIDYILEKLPPIVEKLRKMSPLYKR